MAIIVRIDVDSPFGWQNFFRKALSRIHLDFSPISLRYYWLGYHTEVRTVARDLMERKIPAYWFYQLATRPSRTFAKMLMNCGHEIGFHAVQDVSWETFRIEYEKFEKKVGLTINGFTKHGSGKLKLSYLHSPNYNPPKLLNFAKRAGLEYFWGNYGDPSKECQYINGIQYYEGVFWLNTNYRDKEKFTFDWLLHTSKKRDIIALFHPLEIATNKQVRDLYNQLIELPASCFKHP